MLLSVIGRLFGGGRRGRESAAQAASSLEALPDEELMLRFGRGEHAAFEVLLKRHEGPLFRFVMRFVGSRPLAEDLVQETFVRVCKSAASYTTRARFTTWLYTIARNLCIDHLRRSRGRSEVSLDRNPTEDTDDDRSLIHRLADGEAPLASSELVREEFRKKLQDALDALPEEQREVFTLRQFGGLKFREIADVVGISENTVKSRMRYALETLRGHLEAYRDFSFDAEEAADAQHLR